MNLRPFFFVLGILLPVGILAQEVYELDPRYPVHDLDSVLEIFEDAQDAWSALEVLQKSGPADFRGDRVPRYLEIGKTYWGRLSLLATDSLTNWVLQFEDQWLGPPAWTKSNGKVDVYGFVGQQEIFHKKTGVEYPAAQRDTRLHWTLNSVDLSDLPPGTPVTLVLRAQGNDLGYPAYFNLSARAPDQLFYHEPYSFHRSFNILIFGITLIFFIYHLLQFLYLRERVIFWFALWLLFCCITQAMTTGLIIGSITHFRHGLQLLVATGIFYVFWFFGRAFTDSPRKFPKLDRLILILTGLIMLELAVVLSLKVFTDIQSYMTGVGYHYAFLFVYSILGGFLSLAFLMQKDRFARYFGVGSLIANLALAVGTLWAMGIIRPPFGADPFAFGILSQLLIYSFGIVYRRRKLALQAQAERIKAAQSEAEVQRIRDLDELKTRFFTNISHELRTPLTLIQGPVRQALEQQDPSEPEVGMPRKAFQMVARNTRRLHALVDELLELSRIESGAIALTLTRGNLPGFLRVLASSFQSMAERNNIRFILELDGEDPEAVYDAEKLEKIVNNLLSNAFKYTPGGGEVRFKGEILEGKLSLEVSDTGKGIAEDELDTVFDRFYRVEGTEEKGSGIGLALCKELVEIQNGQIAAESHLGRGTCFKVALPTRIADLPGHAVKQPEAEASVPTAHAQPIATTPANQSDATEVKGDLPMLLLVEDHPDLQEYIREGLREKYNVLLASDGLQGERMAIEHIPDLVISDVMMPRKDGFEFCHSLKTNTKTSHIPVILLTAKAGQSNKMEGLYQGADAYLTKPFDFEELRLRIENLLQAKQRLWESFKEKGALLVDDLPLESLDSQFLQKVLSRIEEHLDSEDLNVAMLARSVGFSRSQLNRKLKALTNQSPNQLINDIRLSRAHRLLQNQTGNVSEVAYAVGFSSLSYFTKRFKAKYGCAPSEVVRSPAPE